MSIGPGFDLRPRQFFVNYFYDDYFFSMQLFREENLVKRLYFYQFNNITNSDFYIVREEIF